MLFKEQIEKRLEQENLQLHEAVDKFVEAVGLQSRSKKKYVSENRALKQVLEALGVPEDRELDEEDTFLTREELLSRVLNPHGIMHRRVDLKRKWWKTAVGPMLGFDKEDKWVALLPSKMKMGYYYINLLAELI